MTNNSTDALKPFVSAAPGRLCLFGEHSDYLELPVIALALPLQCKIHVTPTPESRVLVLELPPSLCTDSNSNWNYDDDDNPQTTTTTWRCDLDNLPPSPQPNGKMDFALSAVHEVLKEQDDDGHGGGSNWELKCGAHCRSTTTIPLQAGCSSSSAFTVAWVHALARLAGRELSPIQLAKLAHRAEVVHYGAPGGTMDHITSALGGILRIGPHPWQVQRLPNLQNTGNHAAGMWVLADSGQPKDTMGHLKRCKHDRLVLYDKLGNDWNASTLPDLMPDEAVLLEATRTNLVTESTAASIWNTATSGKELGALMMRHHEALRDGLRLSTDRLEAMCQAAMDHGAWGYKVVGSGGGGCAVAWCPTNNAEAVSRAMEMAGAVRTYRITEAFHGAMIDHDDS